MKIKDLNLNNRLDVFIKILYIKSFIEKNDFEFYKKLYQKHIKLFNGCHEDHKTKIDDFEKDFQKLILNIKENGFDKNYLIPVNKKGEILNGAHRLACCMYFGIEPVFEEKEGNGVKWGFNWFQENIFFEDELLEIFGCYTKYVNNFSIIILWQTLFNESNNFINLINEKYNIVGYIDLDFGNNFNEFLYDVYSFDKNEINLGLGFFEKAEYLNKYGKKVKVLLLNNKSEDILNNKKELRGKFIKNTGIKDKEKASFFTFHSSDNDEEAKYLTKVIFNKTNIFYLKNRNFQYREDFINRLENFINYINENNIKKDEICLVGSTPMEIFNLNKTSDIDYISKINENKGIIKINDEIDLLDYNYSNNILNKEIIDNNYFYFRGIKFIKLELLKDIKINGGREKDIKQVKIINNFLNGKNKKIKLIDKINLELIYFKKRLLIKFEKIILFIAKVTKKIGIYEEVSYFYRKYILKIKK